MGCVELCRALDVPIHVGEFIFSIYDFAEYIRRGAVDVVRFIVDNIGGITGGMKVAHLAECFGLECAPHNWGNVFDHAVHFHCELAMPNNVWFEMTQPQTASDRPMSRTAFASTRTDMFMRRPSRDWGTRSTMSARQADEANRPLRARDELLDSLARTFAEWRADPGGSAMLPGSPAQATPSDLRTSRLVFDEATRDSKRRQVMRNGVDHDASDQARLPETVRRGDDRASRCPAKCSRAAEITGPKPLRGIFPIAQTPFTEADKLDLDALVEEVRFIDRGRVHGFVWPQLASEWSTLTEQERLEGMEAIASTAQGLRPAIVLGVQAPDVATAVKYAKHAERSGRRRHHLAPSLGAKRSERHGLITTAKSAKRRSCRSSCKRWAK